MPLRTIDQESFFGGAPPAPTNEQTALCQWTPWRDVACLLRLCDLHRPKRFLEVGCHRAATTLLLSEALPDCFFVGVDPGSQVMPWERNPIQAGEYLPQVRIGELAAGKSNVRIHRCRFDELPNVGRFDGIFLDGDHRSAALKADVDRALSLLNAGGFIAAHDCGNPLTPAVEPTLAAMGTPWTLIQGTWLAFTESPK